MKCRQLCIACDFIYRWRYDHYGNAITSFSVKLKRKWPIETSTSFFLFKTYDCLAADREHMICKKNVKTRSIHCMRCHRKLNVWRRMNRVTSMLTHFSFRQLQMLSVQMGLVIRRKASICHNMVNSVWRWASVFSWWRDCEFFETWKQIHRKCV